MTEASDKSGPVEDLLSISNLIVSDGLYRRRDLNNDAKSVRRLMAFDSTIDIYCIHCKRVTPFKDIRSRGSGAALKVPSDEDYLKPQTFTVVLTCQRYELYPLQHSYQYIFRISSDKTIEKIGQYPSLGDILNLDVAKFAPVLDKDSLAELKRASGLFAHDIGIGSFVYLRRVIEKLVNDEIASAHADGDKAVEGIESARLMDKIEALKHRLPPALFRYREAYGVLSKGVHELDEETCRKHFPLMQAIIFLILDDHLRARQKKKTEEELERAFRLAVAEVKSDR